MTTRIAQPLPHLVTIYEPMRQEEMLSLDVIHDRCCPSGLCCSYSYCLVNMNHLHIQIYPHKAQVCYFNTIKPL